MGGSSILCFLDHHMLLRSRSRTSSILECLESFGIRMSAFALLLCDMNSLVSVRDIPLRSKVESLTLGDILEAYPKIGL